MQLHEHSGGLEFVHNVPTSDLVRLAWMDDGHRLNCMTGRSIDASTKRLHVEVSYTIPLGTSVTIRASGMASPRSAQVKYVTSNGTKFILVLDWV